MLTPSIYAVIADIIAIFHGFIVAYLMSFFIFAILLKRKFPLWYVVPCIVIIPITFFGQIMGDCPLVFIEKHFRNLASQEIYMGSFIVHHFQRLGIALDGNRIIALETIISLIITILFLDILTRKWKMTSK